jgi:hypothetical protein
VFYELGNLARGEETAKLSPKTWWANMRRGWEWDANDFTVNQFGHPYQGNNYFTAGRANGLDFWESSALTAFGSATWEFFGETARPSLNDFINTTLGGIALGEMFHRTAWLVRDTHATGKSRTWKEIGAMAIDPVTGYNRIRTGDWGRVVDTPPDMVPSGLGSLVTVGAIWRDSNTTDVESDAKSSTEPFVELDLLYGNPEKGHSERPYDAFGVRLTFGGGSSVSEARVRGRLLGGPVHNGSMQLTVLQNYDYNKNSVYQFGAQAVDVNLGFTHTLNSHMTLWATAWGGVTILGAVDSVAPDGTLPLSSSGSSGEEEVTRDYDYGPGGNFGGFAHVDLNHRDFLRFAYEAHHLHVLDGLRANHLLQRVRADANVPLKGRLGVAVTAELFSRRTYYQDITLTDAYLHYPQFRVALSWSTP